MNLDTDHPPRIEDLISPENELEQQILADPQWLEGAWWGKPRWGHPEGAVVYHIQEVLDNIDRLNPNPEIRKNLRLIALTHDNFKHLEHKGSPRDWSKHHAMFARTFAEKYNIETHVLDVIELHDEAYYAWRIYHKNGNKEEGSARLEQLIKRLNGKIQLFYLFFKCDTQTGDKTQEPVHWFESTVKGIQLTKF